MKRNYILLITSCLVLAFIIFSFKKKADNTIFIEIYNDSQYSILSRRESATKAWIKFQYHDKKIKNKSGKYTVVGGKMILQLWETSCYSKSYDISNFIEYDNKGKVKHSSDFGMYNKVVVPETIGEVIFKHICANNDQSYFYNDYDSDSTYMDVDSTYIAN